MNKSHLSECTEALRKLGFDYGEAVLLLHSPEEMLTSDSLSNITKDIIKIVLTEEEQLENSIDSIDKKIFKIDIDLLELMFKESFSKDVLSFIIVTERAEMQLKKPLWFFTTLLKKKGMII